MRLPVERSARCRCRQSFRVPANEADRFIGKTVNGGAQTLRCIIDGDAGLTFGISHQERELLEDWPVER